MQAAPSDLRAPDPGPPGLRLSDFDYALPPELIAQRPADARTASRLLDVDAAGPLHDRAFTDLPRLLAPGDLLVFNDTRVIKARLQGRKASGGAVELLIERVLDTWTALAMIRASHAPKSGSTIRLDGVDVVVEAARTDATGLARLRFTEPVLDVLERIGRLPLPPYIVHPADADDEQRYQTVFANEPGAVAAPTAGLHFDATLLDTLRSAGIASARLTLHVGAGTFLPVREDDLSRHRMHYERFTIPAATAQAISETRTRGGRVVAVGTTTLRALEAAAAMAAVSSTAADSIDPAALAMTAETDLFITPGYRFRVVDRLITNFHLPKSTLLILVSAFAGIEAIRGVYAHAVAQRYRFFSYGDAMLLTRASVPTSTRASIPTSTRASIPASTRASAPSSPTATAPR